MTFKLPEEGSGEDIFNVVMATNEKSSRSVETTVSTPKILDDDGSFMYIVMAAVAGTVFLIITLIIFCYIVKSRRRRQQNIRIYQERQERPLTVTLAVIDSGDLIQEVGNGVHNSLYNQSDSIIPIVLYDSQAEQDRSSQHHTSVHLPEITSQGGSRESESSQKSSSLQRTYTLASSASEKESSTSPVTTIVYENTKFSNNMFLSANDKQKQISMPNLNDGSKFFVGMSRRHNSQKQTISVKVVGDYETAFPPFGKKTSRNSARNDDNSDPEIQSVKNPTTNRDPDRSHMVKYENRENRGDAQVRHKSTSSYTEGSDSGSKKLKPEVKPKPKSRVINKVNTDIGNEQESSHNQSAAKMKRAKFKQTNLNLNAVPPPCNKVTYVNVPQSSSPDSTSGNSQHDRSTTTEKKTTNSSFTDKLDFGTFDYVNIPEKKHAQSSEHVNIPDNAKTVSGEMMDGQYVNVPEKKPINSGSGKSKSKETREYVNVPDKKPSNFKLHERKGSETKDYVNVPDKKSITSVTKSVFDVKVNAKNNVPEDELRKSEEGNTETEESNCYVNIPENISINVIPERPSSDYEDPGCIKSLKKDPKLKDERIMKESKDHVVKEKLKRLKNVTDLKPVYNKNETRRLEATLGVPKQAPSAVRGRSISESPTNNELDYENKDAVVELQLAMKRKFRRGLSTSLLETSGRCGEWRTGQERAKTQDMSVDDKLSDDGTYLAMDTRQTEDDIYLEMDSPNNSPYVDMTSPVEDVEDEVYVPMTGNNSKTILSKSKTLQPERNEDIAFAVRTCPKPCGGASGVYDNFSENPPHYANCFRSKSTNNLNEYSYADTKPIVKLD